MDGVEVASTQRTAFEDLPELATRKQVAEYTQTSIPTLARWAAEGTGPRVVRLGPGQGAIRYRREDVLAWIQERASAAASA